MKRALAMVALVGVAGFACGKSSSDSVVYVTVTAPVGLMPVTQLRVNLSYAGKTDTELFPSTNSTKAISFAPAATFVLDLPLTASGSIDISIDALDSLSKLVSHGENTASIVAGGRFDVAITLGAGNDFDGGVPVVDASGTAGTGGVTGKGEVGGGDLNPAGAEGGDAAGLGGSRLDAVVAGTGGVIGTASGGIGAGGTLASGGTTGSGASTSTGGMIGAGGNRSTGGAISTGGTTGPPPAVDCTDVSSDSSSMTLQYGAASISVNNNPNKSYIMQANWWGTPYSAQSEALNGIGFTITNPSNAVTSNPSLPLGYPSIYIGSYQCRNTKGSNLPKAVSALTEVPTIISTNVDQKGSASYNAAYDVWLTAGSAPLGCKDTDPGPGGTFLMVWLFMPSDKQPRGSIKVRGGTVDGVAGDWDVWYDPDNKPRPCVSYVAATKTPSLSFDLNDFIQHAIKNSLGVTSSQYLSIIFGGFEVWGGGDGVQLKQFCANVK